MKRPTTGSLTLTTLPDIAIDEILTRLPIEDAVRTSVLSRAWRRRWQSIPALDLRDLSDIAISQLLLRHSSPVMSCDFRPLPKKNKVPCPVYCWLSSLSHRSASTLLSLTLFFDGPLSINSLAGYFPNLTYLCLSCHISISPDCSSGIPNLRTLHLEYFCTNLSLLVSQFPLLEKLIVKNMNILAEGENSNIVEEPSSDIVVPNLRWLELFNVRLDNFTITNAPLLETLIVSHCLDEDGNSWLSLEVLAGAPRIKKLEVDDMCLGVWAWNVKQDAEGKISMRIPVVMDSLRVMSLSVMFTSKKQIALTLLLLRSSPTLEELEIRGCQYSPQEEEYRAGKEFWEAQKHVDVFDSLIIVKMTEIEGIKSEVDFIHFVLAKAQTLKTMMVTISVESFKTKEWLKTKLLGFPRASNQARILLTDEAEAEELEEWG